MNISKSSSRSVLFQILIFLLFLVVVVLMQGNTLHSLYVGGESGRMGLILNGLIVALFLAGLIRIIVVLLSYAREQETLQHLVINIKKNVPSPIVGLSSKSLAVRRYEQIRWINEHNAPVNQGALASSFNASESSRFTLIRFVHNILILTGVFGTVVSLSIALVGASGLLDSPESMQQMSTVINSMSTALSTTITAIVCFIVYAYFYLRLNDVKTQLLSGIEDVTSLYILPKMTNNEGSLMRDVAKLTVALRQAAERMAEVEQRFVDAGSTLQMTVDSMHKQVTGVNAEMSQIKALLSEGFRLPYEPPRKVDADAEIRHEQ